MLLLEELLGIKQDSDYNQLLEDLGNLKDLGMGSLINTFKQRYSASWKRKNLSTSEVGKKIQGAPVGKDSPIIDVETSIKKWADVMRAYRKNSDANPQAAAFKLNGKPVAMLVAAESTLRRGGDACGLAWDLTKSGLDAKEQDEMLSTLSDDSGGWSDEKNTTKGKSEHDTVSKKYVSTKEKLKATGKSEHRDWELNDKINHEYDKPKQYLGVAQTTNMVKAFIDKLAAAGTLTVQLVGQDIEGQDKRRERYKNQPIDPKEMSLFSETLSKRLAKYKNTKIDTAEDAAEFVKKVFEGGMKKINFMGSTYLATPSAKTLYTKTGFAADGTMKNLLSGKEVSVDYEGDKSVSNYGTVTVFMKLTDGMLKPTKLSVGGKTMPI